MTHSGPEHAAAVRCPALVGIGALDRMTTPKAGHALAAAIPGARTAVLAGVGHMLMVEAPDAAREAIVASLSVHAD